MDTKPLSQPSPSPPSATPPVSSELPFLVTHWLSNYGSCGAAEARVQSDGGQSGDGEDGTSCLTVTERHSTTERSADAVARIRRAASELANAFQDLGAYGTTNSVSWLELKCIDLA